jgi:hypothetical protein
MLASMLATTYEYIESMHDWLKTDTKYYMPTFSCVVINRSSGFRFGPIYPTALIDNESRVRRIFKDFFGDNADHEYDKYGLGLSWMLGIANGWATIFHMIRLYDRYDMLPELKDTTINSTLNSLNYIPIKPPAPPRDDAGDDIEFDDDSELWYEYKYDLENYVEKAVLDTLFKLIYESTGLVFKYDFTNRGFILVNASDDYAVKMDSIFFYGGAETLDPESSYEPIEIPIF